MDARVPQRHLPLSPSRPIVSTALLSHPTLVFVSVVAFLIGWRVIRMFWAPQRGQLSGQDLAVLLRAAALKKRDPAAAEAMVRPRFEPRVQALERLETILARPRGD